MIIHICGASGSGKSYLGKQIENKLKKYNILVTDMDILWESFLKIKNFSKNPKQIKIKYQEHIDNFIKQNKKYEYLFFVGLNAFLPGGKHWFEDNSFINLPSNYFNLHSDINLYIDIDTNRIVKQQYDRGYKMYTDNFCNYMNNNKDNIYDKLLKNENKAKKELTDTFNITILDSFNFSSIKKEITRWNKY